MPRPARQPIAVLPRCAVPGARITIRVSRYDVGRPTLPEVRVGGFPARVVYASERAVAVLVPEGAPASARDGGAEITVEGVEGSTQLWIGLPVATGLHQVDNPVFDREGNLYVTYSGTRGERVPVSVFKVGRDGSQDAFVSGIVNATSVTIGPDDRLYVSSRFEGKVYRVDEGGQATAIGTDLGIACGLAFASDGSLFVGDRSGTIFRLDPATGVARPHATLPSSIAAFHLALGPGDSLYVAGPTLNSYDHVYHVDADGRVDIVTSEFGRPQGLAYRNDKLYVVDAAAGWNGVYRIVASGMTEAFVSGTNLIGLAFDPGGGFVVSSNDTAYRFFGVTS